MQQQSTTGKFVIISFHEIFCHKSQSESIKNIIVDKKTRQNTTRVTANLPVYETAHKIGTYCWFGSAVFAKPCLRYLTSVGFTVTGSGATPGCPGSFLANLSMFDCQKSLLVTDGAGDNTFLSLLEITSFHLGLKIRCDILIKYFFDVRISEMFRHM